MKELSRNLLEKEYHLKVFKDETAECGYKIYHYATKAGYFGNKQWNEINPHLYTKKHPYGTDKQYYIITFSNRDLRRTISISLQRLVYAWFVDTIPAGYQVDHIDNNSLNNDVNNLQLLTQSDNLKKKLPANQYTTGKFVKEAVNIFDVPMYLGLWIVRHQLIGKVYKNKSQYYYYEDNKRVVIKLNQVKKEV